MEETQETVRRAKVKINVAMMFIDRFYCSGDVDNLSLY